MTTIADLQVFAPLLGGDKMREYARAGIGTYWRVEFDERDEPDVCVHHLRGMSYSQVQRLRLDELLKLAPASVIAPPTSD